jgi:hypothetical protein
VVVAGIAHEPSQLDTARLVYFERELVGVLGYRFDHRRVLALLAAGVIDLVPLRGGPIALSDLVAEGLEPMRHDPGAPVRILVSPRG